jgi:hypothetical protein
VIDSLSRRREPIDDRWMRWWVAACVLAGCFAPHPGAGSPCPDGTCPTGLVCSPATLTCEVTGMPRPDAATDGVPSDDAPPPPPADMPPPPPAPQLVQQEIATTMTGDTLAVTLPQAPVPGNVVVMVGGGVSAGIDVISGGAATWTVATASTIQSNAEIWFAVADGTRTVTIHIPGSVDQSIFMNVSEWSGVAAVGTLDIARHRSGSLGGPASTPVLTTSARDLIVLGVSTFLPSTFGSPGAEWTEVTEAETADIVLHAWYVVEPPGTYSPTVPITSEFWDAAIAGLKASP